MANRNFRSNTVYSMEKDVKQVFADITFGAVGAPTLSATNSKAVASVTRISAGLFEITFGTPASSQAMTVDVYRKLLIARVLFTSTAAPAAPLMYVSLNTVATNGKIRVQFNAAGVATDPAATENAKLQFTFGDSNT